jgi:hypothetical protein
MNTTRAQHRHQRKLGAQHHQAQRGNSECSGRNCTGCTSTSSMAAPRAQRRCALAPQPSKGCVLAHLWPGMRVALASYAMPASGAGCASRAAALAAALGPAACDESVSVRDAGRAGGVASELGVHIGSSACGCSAPPQPQLALVLLLQGALSQVGLFVSWPCGKPWVAMWYVDGPGNMKRPARPQWATSGAARS